MAIAVAVIWGMGETLTLHTVIGGVLAIGGVAVINLWPAGRRL